MDKMTSGIYKRTKKHKKALSVSHLGQKAWNKLSKKKIYCEFCNKIIYTNPKSKKRFCSIKCKNNFQIGKKHSEEAKKKMKDKIMTDLIREKISNSLKKLYKEGKLPTGKKHHWWNGGTQYESYSIEWTKFLRESVKKRDKYRCQGCGKEDSLIIHHINMNKKNSNINNLITLCRSCHYKIHRGNKK